MSRFNPVQRWFWRNPGRRGRRLLRFAETEADGGRDLARAAETTSDPRLRGLYLRHAMDEQRHAELLRRRGSRLILADPAGGAAFPPPDWLVPGERGLDDVRVEPGADARLLAFLHLSEAAAGRAFAAYGEAVGDADRQTRSLFDEIRRDEVFHMRYTRNELGRIAPRRQRRMLWRARLSRLWKLYLRLAAAIGGAFGSTLLILQYFVLLPPFAWAAKRAERREPPGWTSVAGRARDLGGQY